MATYLHRYFCQRFDEDQQVRMIYLGSITREGLSKGVPAFKKANGNWEMVSFMVLKDDLRDE